jgi:phosphate/sulfate permease
MRQALLVAAVFECAGAVLMVSLAQTACQALCVSVTITVQHSTMQ